MYICIDGTGVPVVKSETKNRRGKCEDGQAKTREAKLGCVFTQTAIDEKGYPIRDEGSTSYVGSIETAEEFGNRIYAEAVSRGIERAKRVCVIGDGAPWIWNIADVQFYGATKIIDIYHAREHYWKVAKIMFGRDKSQLKIWTDERRRELDRGDVEQVIEEGFILDVLENYTTFKRYFKLAKKVESDKEYEKKKALKMLMSYVDLHPHEIEMKSRIMLEHFLDKMVNSIQGRGRAMVVTSRRSSLLRMWSWKNSMCLPAT